MKPSLILCLLFFCSLLSISQSVAVNTDGTPADESAMLDVMSTTKGILIPRMTTAQRTIIASPAKGLLVFDDETAGFWFYSGTGWVSLSSGGATNSWSANGTSIFNNNAGNVGIGTNTPANKLTVKSAYDNFGITHTDGTYMLSSYIGRGGGAWFGTQSNHKLHLNTNNNGMPNVTFNPDFTTHIRGIKPRMEFYDETTGFNLAGDIRSNNRNLEIAAYKSSGFATPGNLLLQLDQIGIPPFGTSFYAGNIGVGVSDPAFKLDIKNRIRLRSESTTETAGLWLNNPSNTTPIAFIGVADAVTAGFYGNTSGWGLIMNTNTGNVGIGTLNPTTKLAVNGVIRSKEVVVETGWADYVFDKNYKLPSLDEVEKFIKQNKHLPNIPSAAEIEKNGLHVGDTQKRMMEKIEELTLYVIELKKEIDLLKTNRK